MQPTHLEESGSPVQYPNGQEEQDQVSAQKDEPGGFETEGHVFLPGSWIAAGRMNRGTKLQASGHMAIFAGFSRQAMAV